MVKVCAVAWCKKKLDTKSVRPKTKETMEREEYTCTIWGNCEHWWVQKGKDDLADISVFFFLYGLLWVEWDKLLIWNYVYCLVDIWELRLIDWLETELKLSDWLFKALID